ncbi:MAG: hypothetical protein FD180_296 [Planctomycetota bacterium]|nr:MAG: hypothetical protein FD180_296 [Planctomycetota bacterium]
MRIATLVFAVVCSTVLPAASEEAGTRTGIAWYGTWERGSRVAKATGRPILLISAAPQCHGISGLW